MTPHTYDIAAILDRLPEFTLLFERDGHTPHRSGGGWFVPCPFHNEKTPSCSINNKRQKFHCYGCGAAGDPFDYWQKAHDLTFQEALEQLASIAGVGPACQISAPVQHALKPAITAVPILPLAGPALAKWHHATRAMLSAPAEIARIATWRGIHPEAVAFAAARGLLGSYQYWGLAREAFLVEMPSPSGLIPVSVHVRLAPGSKGNEYDLKKASWRYDPAGCGAWPWVVGDLATAKHIFVIEGQWDALALISLMGWHTAFPKTVAVVGLRGATSGQKLLHHNINPEAYLFAMADADGAGDKWFEDKGLLASLGARVRKHRLHAFWPDATGDDLNDMVKNGSFTRELMLALLRPMLPSKLTRPPGPTFVQWCRKHSKDSSPEGIAARYILADPIRPRGRRPLTVWKRHWQRTAVPADLLPGLHAAWDTYRAHPTA